jgi:hypothetical protein
MGTNLVREKEKKIQKWLKELSGLGRDGREPWKMR